MALSIANVLADVGSLHCIQTDATSTVDVLKGSSGTIHKVEIDNTGNTSAVFVKLWDTTGSVTVGTTDPDFSFKCPASVLRVYSCPNGTAFAAGLKAACVTDGGGTAGTTSPSNDVIYRIQLG
tara:strand:+ start:2156 stop:2524 length:369 start_codon:yes stop_codon:yes gene_type:complete